jgi:hypothetical protein
VAASITAGVIGEAAAMSIKRRLFTDYMRYRWIFGKIQERGENLEDQSRIQTSQAEVYII